MPHPLDGARLKFDRGGVHVDMLRKDVGCFLKQHTRRVTDKYDAKAGRYVRHVQASPTPPQWSVLLGEIAHNFRSCLDHIAWQLAIAASPTDNPEHDWEARRISFPLYARRAEYLDKRNSRHTTAKRVIPAAWRHAGLLPHHRRLVRHHQPYQRRHAPESHPLWHLRSLSNIDKHQVLHTTLVGVDETMPPPGHFLKKVLDPETGEAEYHYDFSEGGAILPGAQMTVVATVGGPSEADMYFEGDLPFQIEIEQPQTVLHEQPMLRLVDGIRAEVGAVLEAFTPTL